MPDEIRYPETPTLERVKEIQPQLDVINDFMDWLLQEQGYVLAGHQHHDICDTMYYGTGDCDKDCSDCEMARAEC